MNSTDDKRINNEAINIRHTNLSDGGRDTAIHDNDNDRGH